MNLGHALMEIYAVIFLFGYTDVGTGSKRIVLFFDRCHKGRQPVPLYFTSLTSSLSSSKSRMF